MKTVSEKNKSVDGGMECSTFSAGNGNECGPEIPSRPPAERGGRRSKSGHRYIALAARIILGAVFIYASIDKVLHPEAFAENVFNYQLLPGQLINLAAMVLPWLELILGLLLLSGCWPAGATLGVNLLLAVFLAALVFNTARGLNISCGCFSTDASAERLSWWLVLRDLPFLAIALFLMDYHIIRPKPE